MTLGLAGQPLGQCWLQDPGCACNPSQLPGLGKKKAERHTRPSVATKPGTVTVEEVTACFFPAPELSWIQSSLRLRKPTPLQGRECDNEQQTSLPQAHGAISTLAPSQASSRESRSRWACRNVCRALRSARLSVRRIPGSASSSTAQELLCRNQRDVGVGEIRAPTASWPHNGSSTSELPGNIILSSLWF